MVEMLKPARTLKEATDRDWLTQALKPVSGGAAVQTLEVVEVIKTMATKVRFAVQFAGSDESRGFCLKGFLDVDAATAKGGATTVREADFYAHVAPLVSVRTPTCVSSIIDRENQQGVIIMRDLIQDGARFCSALEAFTVEQAAQSLEQIARLHVRGELLERFPWIDNRIAQLAQAQYVAQPLLQELLDGPRGAGLPARTRDAAVLLAGMKALAHEDRADRQTLVHGDAHAGNIYRTAEGPGLIDWQLLQKGGWALDVPYHICAVLQVADAEREERRLLSHYLEAVRAYGGEALDPETAWARYRASIVYGFYLWSITRRVDPAITNVFVQRLGAAVTRHDSYRLLGL
jgi:aminoglycoside/choline kinase family phosphotransferase